MGEAGQAESARVAVSTTGAGFVGIVAAVGEAVVDAQLQAGCDDLGFAHLDEWRADGEFPMALDTGGRGEVGHRLEGGYKLGSAVGVSAVVDGIDADENIVRADHLGVPERDRQKDRVSRRHIGDRNARVVDILRDGDIVGQGLSSKPAGGR